MISKLIAYLRNGSEHIYWDLDIEGEVHLICDLWINGLQECNDFSKSGKRATNFGLVDEI